LSGVNAAANWQRHHLITFLNCATQLLYADISAIPKQTLKKTLSYHGIG
jgi:hypothetical protein